MIPDDLPPAVMVLGLALVYTSLVILFWVVLKSRNVISAERRRPGAPVQATGLTKLTNATLGVIDARIQPRSGSTGPPIDSGSSFPPAIGGSSLTIVVAGMSVGRFSTRPNAPSSV